MERHFIGAKKRFFAKKKGNCINGVNIEIANSSLLVSNWRQLAEYKLALTRGTQRL
jgi:hypothetical protein